MKSIQFKESNKTYAKNQAPYKPIDVLEDTGQVVSCWNLSILERLKVLFTGKVWLCLLTFGKPLTPSKMSVSKERFINKKACRVYVN